MRKTQSNWYEFLVATQQKAVDPVRLLRDETRVVQYWEGQQELMAINDAAPYGQLGKGSRSDLLIRVGGGEGYTIFEVPPETFSLKALTLGTGRRNALLLGDTYRRVGETLGRLIGATSAPLMNVEDFAVVRPSGNVLFLPPSILVRVPTTPASM